MGCAIIDGEDGRMFICGKGITPCHFCMEPADYLCDYPVGSGKTCDLALCEKHSNTMADEIDFCPICYSKFKEKGTVNFKQDVLKL